MVKIPKSAGGNKTWHHAPKGKFAARVMDIADLGYEKDEYQGDRSIKLKARVSYLLECKYTDEETGDEKNYMVSEWVTQSLNPKAKLTSRVEAIVFGGETLPAEDKSKFESEEDALDSAMIGTACIVIVDHTANGKSKVANVLPLDPRLAGDAPKLPEDYVRWGERTDESGNLINRPEPYPADGEEWLKGTADFDRPVPIPKPAEDEVPF